MENTTFGQEFLKELEAEAPASRKCLERVSANLFSYKPHEKSMAMGYLALIVAEIPGWITHMVEQGDIDFATYKHVQATTPEELVKQFDDNMARVRTALQNVSDAALAEPFALKNHGQVLFSSPKKDNIGSSINHMVHHRGQLTVYLRLNDIDVPSIYGPSADEKAF